ncbi:lactate dehydrogenase [Clostridium aminobutyricum]|uniref:Lactate dehydrogenase n=1 Tax=Clostridium aminobutyricum TaxID=33953 RepID=A0A939D8U9_CLOAM|nr:lactate dehydrogenase [Clostridium aminobutyricum]MBN7772898.1 lactate dehydrogenase [Clostridium aminobutyricum]
MHKLSDLSEKYKSEGYLPFNIKGKKRVNLLALGDVGGMLLTGLKLLGSDVISEIGICDINENVAMRYEMEMNQIVFPFEPEKLPDVKMVKPEALFDCDVFVFCASKGVPEVGTEVRDVRMIQFEGNKAIVEQYARLAAEKKFKGLFAIVSDPVDPLCKAAYLASNREEQGHYHWNGLCAQQFQGYGLGVMNSRAIYFAKKEERYKQYLKEGRAFGPHGEDLVIANSIEHYNQELSDELTKLTVESNRVTRQLGFKPYIAPALSSGAISILLTMRGDWHYSSNYIGFQTEGAFMGALNRMTKEGLEWEDLNLPESLFYRIKRAYDRLQDII